MRRITYHLITLLFVGLFVLALRDVWTYYLNADTVVQDLDLVGQVTQMLSAAAVVLLRLGRRREARRFIWVWGAALVWASGLNPAAWEGAGWGPSLTAAGSALAVAVVILLVDAWANARPLAF